MALRLDRDFDVPYGRVEQVSPLVRRLVAENPGPFTFKGTGTYLVGRGALAVVDPGPDLASHADALLAAVAGEEVTHILVTHTHRDHSPAARLLQEATGAVVVAFGPHPPDPGTLDEAAEEAEVATEEPHDAAFVPDLVVGEGDEVTGTGWTVDVLHTPGHIANHLCFGLREERALFPGDHVMGWSTTVVAPPLGDMGAYLANLRRLLHRDDEVYWPTHGPPVRTPHDLVRGLVEHREEREAQVLARLDAGDRRVPQIVAALYADVDERLHKAAGRSVLAHLLLLREQGRVVAEGPLGAGAEWRLAGG